MNIKQKNCKFIVKPEDKLVICIIEGHSIPDMVNSFIDTIKFKDIEFFENWEVREKLNMPHSFVGKAKCSEDDEWNEEFGKKLAYTRAKSKLYTSFFKRANRYVQLIDHNLNEVITRFNKLGEEIGDEQKKLRDELGLTN